MRKQGTGIMSMSGYGRASARVSGWEAICEIRTVNPRNLDISMNLPAGLLGADAAFRQILRTGLARGRAELSISITARGRGRAKPVMDGRLAVWYGRRLRGLARELRLPLPATESLAMLPGVLETREESRLPPAAIAAAKRSAMEALEPVKDMRAREGRALARDLLKRLAGMERAVERLEREWIPAREKQAARVRERLVQALERLEQGGKIPAAKEIVAMVERGDVNEEITRFRSLAGQFRGSIRSGSPAGRRLDFIAQEMQREVNTISAKCSDASLTRTIMPAREEIERIREQVQNIE